MDGVDDSLLKNGRFLRLRVGPGLSFVGDFVSAVALVLLVVDVSLVLLHFVSIFAAALAFTGVGLSPTFALGCIAVAGAANGVDNVATATIRQKRFPDAFWDACSP